MSPQKTKKTRQFIGESPIEAIKHLGEDFKDGIVDDLGKQTVNSLWDQLLNRRTEDAKGKDYPDSRMKPEGDLNQGEELSIASLRGRTEELKPRIQGAIDYASEILHAEKRGSVEDTREIKVKMEEIAIELKALIKSSQELQAEFKQVVVEEVPEIPGKYHLSFMEWVLDMVRKTRMKVEDSGAWLQAFYSKKSKRKYWNMFKKHGTTFGLSGERVVSTQTG